jgi:hypothetical protein
MAVAYVRNASTRQLFWPQPVAFQRVPCATEYVAFGQGVYVVQAISHGWDQTAQPVIVVDITPVPGQQGQHMMTTGEPTTK